MAEINGALPAQAGQVGGGANLLASLGEFARAGMAMQENRLLGQEAASRQRMGQLASAATRPDGSFDSTAYVQHILADPTTAPFAPQVMNQFAEKGLIDANSTARNIENWKARYDAIASAAGSVGQQLPSDSSPADTKSFIGRVSDLMGLQNPDGSQMFSPSEITGYLTNALQDVRTNADLKQHLLQLAGSTLRGREQLDNVGTVQGLGPNGEPKLYFFNRLAQGLGGGANSPAAAAYMTGAGGAGPATVMPAASAPAPAATVQPTSASGLTIGPSEPEQLQLKALPDYIGRVNAGAASAQNLNFQLDKLDAVRKQFKQGGGAATYTELGRLMQAAGVRQDWVDKVANGSLPASQTFQSLSQQVAVNLMKQQLLSHDNDTSGAGRLLASEWSSYIANKPNWEHDPRTLDSLLGFMRTQNNISQQKAAALQLTLMRLRKGQSVGNMQGLADVTAGFEPYWINNLYSRGIISQGAAQEFGVSGEGAGNGR